MSNEDLIQHIADYLTGQFIAGPEDIPPDECLEEAKHVISLIEPIIDDRAKEEEYKRWIKACMKAGMLISEPEQLVETVAKVKKDENERILNLMGTPTVNYYGQLEFKLSPEEWQSINR